MHIVERRVPVKGIFIKKELVRLSSKPIGKVLAEIVNNLPDLMKVSGENLVSFTVEKTEDRDSLNARDFFLRYPEIPLLLNQEEAIIALDMALEEKKVFCSPGSKNVFLYRGERGMVHAIEYVCPNPIGVIEVVVVPHCLIEITPGDRVFFLK